MLHTNQVTKSIAWALNGNYSFLHFFLLFLSFTTWWSDRTQICVIVFECVEHPPSPPPTTTTTTTTSTSRKWRWRKYTRIFTPTSAVGKPKKKKLQGKSPTHIHTKGRKRDTHGGNNSALWSYCKFSVGRFFFTFVTLPVPVVKKWILLWVLHINGTGNLVVGYLSSLQQNWNLWIYY